MTAGRKILVTSYTDPDIDGTACCYAYAEFLRHKNIDAQAGFFGQIHREAQFVVDKFNIKINSAENLIKEYRAVALLDASEILRLPHQIKPAQIIAIIDHRKSEDLGKFINAKVQIELVGSCATLIAEKFKGAKMKTSRESAALLYSAIISNTINFQNKLTTNRDKKMTQWLQNQVALPHDYIRQMFAHKSKFTQPFKDILLANFKDFQAGNARLGIASLEIIDVDHFVRGKLAQTQKLLLEIKAEKSTQLIFLNCIDLEKGFNAFIAIDDDTKQVLTSALKIRFVGDIAKSDHIIMRKEIVPLIKRELAHVYD